MRSHRIFRVGAVALLATTFSLPLVADDEILGGEPENRETVLDRVVYIEPELVTNIPAVPRWCDRLHLERRRVDVGDAELFVEVEGSGVPLVLINGGPGGTHHYFHPWFSRAKDYARVIYYDQRGCGLSDFEPGENGYSVEQAVADLDALRRDLGVDKWVVLGYSYGGFLGQLYTIRHPEHVAGLVLMSALPGMWADLGNSRQYEFITDEERTRLEEIRQQARDYSKKMEITRREHLQILLYNNFLNGDWKRQQFYKPSPERLAQIALYEWDNDKDFNSIMGASRGQVDLTGAFEENPIPTLILEGKWDLTWGESKPEILMGNHPHARSVMFDNSGHSIYKEEPDKLFGVIEEFVRNLQPVSRVDVATYRQALTGWEEGKVETPEYAVRSVGWGLSSSQKLVEKYKKDWLGELDKPLNLLRIGFALYDVEDYEEALRAFERMEQVALAEGNPDWEAVGLIWQGHMLDLLGRREKAIERYGRVVAMNVEETTHHNSYGMGYSPSQYAGERTETPFDRIENQWPSR
jgi:proline iminopeptidase